MGLRKLSIRRERERSQPNSGHDDRPFPSLTQVETTKRRAEQGLQKATVQIDHVLSAALRNGRISQEQISAVGLKSSGSDAALSWRQFALVYPEQSTPLFELAANIYGFRRITVCQIGTYIYNTKLTEFFSTTDWNRLFDRGVVPVIQFGHYPEVVRHHLLAAFDPGSPYVRSLQHELPLSHTELVFVPRNGIQKLQSLLATNISELQVNPFIRQRAIQSNRPTFESITTERRAA